METASFDVRWSRFKRRGTSPKHLKTNNRLFEILELFNTYRLLPTNVIHALLGGNAIGLKKRLTKIFDAGLLDRRTFDGDKNIYETMTYSRTVAGTNFLELKGRNFFTDHNTSAPDEEQVQIDLMDAALAIGTRDTSIFVHFWQAIKEHELTPKLPVHPHRFYVDDKHYFIPDGNPLYLKRDDGKSILFLKERVRTHKDKASMIKKLSFYDRHFEDIKKRYGFKGVMVLFVTSTQRDADNILKWTNEVIGPCTWILVQTMEDHIAINKKTPDIPLHLFNEPWRRAQCSPFSLKTLAEI